MKSPSLAIQNLKKGRKPYNSCEHQIADLVCRGHTNAEIAKLLGVTLATVKTHLLRVFSKTDVHNRTALARYLSLRAKT